MKRWKKALCCVLALVMVMCLLPTVALAAGEETVVYIAGTDVSAGGYWTVDNDSNEDHSELDECAEIDNWNVHYDPDTTTLTLQNAELFNNLNRPNRPTQEEIAKTYVIYSNTLNQDFNLVLLGENRCYADFAKKTNSNPLLGMYDSEKWDSNTTIRGGGSLTVDGCAELGNFRLTDSTSLVIDAAGVHDSYTTTGLSCCSITIDGGNLKVETGDSESYMYGIDMDGWTLTLQSGSVTVTTGNTTAKTNQAIFAGAIKLSGGTLMADAGNAGTGGDSTGIVLDSGFPYMEEGLVVNGGTLTAIGKTNALTYSCGDPCITVLDPGLSVMVNEDALAEGATPWDGTTPLIYDYYYENYEDFVNSPYKYVHITDSKPVEPEQPVLPPVPPILGGLPSTIQTHFVDVRPMDYYFDAVNWAYEHGITGGTGKLTFSPDAPCTRAQAVTFLWRAMGSPAAKTEASFTDVKSDAYYAAAVNWAVENGITNGTSADKFSPNATCTRAQIVTLLYRAIGAKSTSDAGFTDVPATAYYADAVNWATANEITDGTGANRFSPDATCTRAQIVTFLYRAG